MRNFLILVVLLLLNTFGIYASKGKVYEANPSMTDDVPQNEMVKTKNKNRNEKSESCKRRLYLSKSFDLFPMKFMDSGKAFRYSMISKIAESCNVSIIVNNNRSVSIYSRSHTDGLTFKLRDNIRNTICGRRCLENYNSEDDENKTSNVKCFIEGLKAEDWKFDPETQTIYDSVYIKAVKNGSPLPPRFGCNDKIIFLNYNFFVEKLKLE